MPNDFRVWAAAAMLASGALWTPQQVCAQGSPQDPISVLAPDDQLPLSLVVYFEHTIAAPSFKTFKPMVEGYFASKLDCKAETAALRGGRVQLTLTPKPGRAPWGQVLVRYLPGPAVSGAVSAKSDGLVELLHPGGGHKVYKESGGFSMGQTVHLEEKFKLIAHLRRVSGPGSDWQNYSVHLRGQGQESCSGSQCPKPVTGTDHAHQRVLFHTAGASALLNQRDAPESLLTLLADHASLSVGPITIKKDSLSFGPKLSFGVGPLKIGVGKSFEVLRFKEKQDLKTPEGGAVAAVGYLVSHVLDGKVGKQEPYEFGTALGLKDGENRVILDPSREKLLRAVYGSALAHHKAHYGATQWPRWLPNMPAGGDQGVRQVQFYEFESSRKFNETSLLVNQITFVMIDVSLALNLGNIGTLGPEGARAPIPLELTYSVWPRGLEQTGPQAAKASKSDVAPVEPLSVDIP